MPQLSSVLPGAQLPFESVHPVVQAVPPSLVPLPPSVPVLPHLSVIQSHTVPLLTQLTHASPAEPQVLLF